MMKQFRVAAATFALALAACSGGEEEAVTTEVDTEGNAAMTENMTEEERSATATLRTPDGTEIGSATAMPAVTGVSVLVEARNLEPGMHGLHVHTVGDCSAPDFSSAGGHWNPTDMEHGRQNPEGPHAGDMPNLEIQADGSGSVLFALPAGTYDGLMDGDGSALVIHAGEDDLSTDPAGDSGDRIACGVFEAA